MIRKLHISDIRTIQLDDKDVIGEIYLGREFYYSAISHKCYFWSPALRFHPHKYYNEIILKIVEFSDEDVYAE